MSHTARTVRTLLCLALVLTTVGILTGCAMNPKDKMVFVFRAYQFANPDLMGGKLSRHLVNYDGNQSVCVRTIPLITTANIIDGELREEDGNYAVKLKLDRIGQDVWLQACQQLGGRDMAITVDGFYLFTATIPHRQMSYDTIIVRGPWGRPRPPVLQNTPVRITKRQV